MYTTPDKILNYLQIDSLPDSASTWITWVSAYIDRYTGTTFTASAVTKYYDVQYFTSRVYIDDFTSLTSVELLDTDGDVTDTLAENTDYWAYPLNENNKNEIRLNPYGKYGRFPFLGSKKIKVTGSFGVGVTVPADIEMVATQMVADIAKQGLGQIKGKKSETLGEYSVTFETIGQYSIPYRHILDLYRCPTL